ncbi:MAG: hypothetical protein KF763_07350 [Cyclobacteriaceae bacterium]|nr:hypothetical protein [Cyclobacteriaceae bacterium]
MRILATILFSCYTASLVAHPGVGIVMDKKGNVFYTDTERVLKIDASGRQSVVIPNVHTHELFLDANDNLYGEHLWYEGSMDSWGHYVWRFSATGQFEKIKPDTKGFLEDYSFARDLVGNMFRANRNKECQQIVKMDNRRKKTPVTDACFESIRWIYANAKGELLFADFQDIVKIDKQGNVKKVAKQIANKRWTKSTVENQNSVFGVWDDAQGNIYTAVASNRVVKKFDTSGQEEIIWRTPAPWTPTGGLVSPAGELWILECSDTNAVRVERINGKKVITY